MINLGNFGRNIGNFVLYELKTFEYSLINTPSRDTSPFKPAAHVRKELSYLPREAFCSALSSRVRRALASTSFKTKFRFGHKIELSPTQNFLRWRKPRMIESPPAYIFNEFIFTKKLTHPLKTRNSKFVNLHMQQTPTLKLLCFLTLQKFWRPWTEKT